MATPLFPTDRKHPRARKEGAGILFTEELAHA